MNNLNNDSWIKIWWGIESSSYKLHFTIFVALSWQPCETIMLSKRKNYCWQHLNSMSRIWRSCVKTSDVAWRKYFPRVSGNFQDFTQKQQQFIRNWWRCWWNSKLIRTLNCSKWEQKYGSYPQINHRGVPLSTIRSDQLAVTTMLRKVMKIIIGS